MTNPTNPFGGAPLSTRIVNRIAQGAMKAKDSVKDASNSPNVRTNARWARRTIIGTAKGVTIAAIASTAGEAVKQGLRKGLRHQR